MKKIILSAIVLLLLNVAFAQNEVQFGIKGGLNFANLKDENTSNTDAKTGFNVGALAHIHLTRSFALQPEVVYSEQGAEYGNGKMKLNYVNIPVLAQYMVANGFRLQTGPQLGILTTSKFKSGDTKTDVDLKTADVAWSFGASYVSPMGLGIDGRYNLGLTDISKSNATDLKNRVWQLGLFYQFKH